MHGKLFVEMHLVELDLMLGFTALYAGIEAKLLQQLVRNLLQLQRILPAFPHFQSLSPEAE